MNHDYYIRKTNTKPIRDGLDNTDLRLDNINPGLDNTDPLLYSDDLDFLAFFDIYHLFLSQ